MSVDSNKVYYAYTPGPSPIEILLCRQLGFDLDQSRATVALKRVGTNIEYGVSVCSHGDNFNKNLGRKLAESRRERGYGKFPIANGLMGKFKDEHEMCLFFLNNITNSVFENIRKTQQKIGAWEAKGKENQQVKLIGNKQEAITGVVH